MNAKVELIDVALKKCGFAGLKMDNVTSKTTVVAKRCEFAYCEFGAIVHGSSSAFYDCTFHDNRATGLAGHDSTIHLYGEATAIYSNIHGMSIGKSTPAIIHLPSHHNTIYNNGTDRHTRNGGTITNVPNV